MTRLPVVVTAILVVGAATFVAPARSYATPPAAPSAFALPGSAAGFARQDPDGRMLYLKNCRTCHGATGTPSGESKAKYPKIRTLNDSAFLAGISDDSLLTVLKKGKGKDMKSWSEKFTEPEMIALIKYVRTLPAKRP